MNWTRLESWYISWFGTIRQTLSLSCLTMFLQQPYNVGLLLIRCHNFLNSNPILLEILFRKFGVNKLISMEVIPSAVLLLILSFCQWWRSGLPLMTSRILSHWLFINSVTEDSTSCSTENCLKICRSGSEDGPWQRSQQTSPYTEEKPSSDQKVIILQ